MIVIQVPRQHSCLILVGSFSILTENKQGTKVDGAVAFAGILVNLFLLVVSLVLLTGVLVHA